MRFWPDDFEAGAEGTQLGEVMDNAYERERGREHARE